VRGMKYKGEGDGGKYNKSTLYIYMKMKLSKIVKR
jgi:hypothetical protein